ncbi:MAG: tripartite tricarboxylate transporter TctB family protein [Pseudomonadota bacterium]
MTDRSLQMQLGLGALIFSAFLIVYAIPAWVSSPSNVGNVVLSPLFWPYALAGFLALTGAGLLLAALRTDPGGDLLNRPSDEPVAAYIRLGAMAVLMGVTMVLLPRLGMVLTSMLLFVATAFLVRTRHPVAALICAVVIPLVLYAFFAHVAGVAVPQGNFLRLP